LSFCIELLNQTIHNREYDMALVCGLAALGVNPSGRGYIRSLQRLDTTKVHRQYRHSAILLLVEREHHYSRIGTRTTLPIDIVLHSVFCTWPSVLFPLQLSIAGRACGVSSSARNLRLLVSFLTEYIYLLVSVSASNLSSIVLTLLESIKHESMDELV
jgi:hypothetical protein